MSELSVKLEDISQVKKKMSFEVPWAFVKDELENVYRDIGKKAKIKGFRPGKIPRKVLENYFKADAEGEAITNIVNKYYWQELDNLGIVTLSRPEIEQDGLKENTDFSFSASFETEPDFEPQGYQGLELEKLNITISEEDLDKRLQEVRKMFATMQDVTEDRQAVMGDFVLIDFSGKLDGQALPELQSENFMLELGSKRFIPGFEEQLVGMKNGESKDVNVTFPEDYHEKKMAGKDVTFNVTLKGLKEQKLPEIDENFIKNFDKYNTLEDLKNDVKKSMEDQCKRQSDAELRDKITEAIVKANEFEAPPSLVERQIFYMISDTQKRMKSAGMDEKNAMELSFRMHDQFKQDAEKTVKSFLLLKKIAEKEAISVSDNDLDNHFRELAEIHHTDYEVVKSAYDNEERMNSLKSEIIQKKVFDFIEQRANIKAVEKIGMAQEAV
ncbi:MAG: trigger factor [Deltaproteobacteria bacterium HGW-Deltaproteobacteria-6]|nr:MAG: trigger factor [Deltaproteobacteria bacterium HGW-Deltaproteobacteria-6]